MKNVLFTLAAIVCLLSASNSAEAQLIIRNSGHAEIGINPNVNDPDTATVLKVFGNKEGHSAGARITFGDSTHVAIGEDGVTNTNRIWLHGKSGVEYEIEASGTVTLHDGFKVEKGATFAVYPSSF